MRHSIDVGMTTFSLKLVVLVGFIADFSLLEISGRGGTSKLVD